MTHFAAGVGHARKVLIANRGEIACRIARTCRRLGLKVATVHSSVDRHARHVREIGESVELGGAAPSDSYLRIDAIVAAALRVGADAVHPGFGFVSENPDFVRALDAAGLIFIGPTAETMERLGGKAQAKREAARLGVPVIAGSEGGMNDAAEVVNAVRGMPLPVLLKAVAGGGGRGMAVVETLDGLDARVESAMREAEKAFGNGELIVERYLPRVRHVEVQIAGDGQGQAIHLFERDCSLQRRHQKLVEEAPAAGLPGLPQRCGRRGQVGFWRELPRPGHGGVCRHGRGTFSKSTAPAGEQSVTEEVTGLDRRAVLRTPPPATSAGAGRRSARPRLRGQAAWKTPPRAFCRPPGSGGRFARGSAHRVGRGLRRRNLAAL
jgi:3-methylcrotonyl-CoA carboxylase alpha subunit